MDEVEIRDLDEDSSPGRPPLKNQDLSQLGLSGKKRHVKLLNRKGNKVLTSR